MTAARTWTDAYGRIWTQGQDAIWRTPTIGLPLPGLTAEALRKFYGEGPDDEPRQRLLRNPQKHGMLEGELVFSGSPNPLEHGCDCSVCFVPVSATTRGVLIHQKDRPIPFYWLCPWCAQAIARAFADPGHAP